MVFIWICSMVVQVMEKLDSLQAERERMEEQWSKKQSWLETVHLEQVFYRDVNSMDKMFSSQEVDTHFLFPRGHKKYQVKCLINAYISPDPAAEWNSGRNSGRD